MELDLKRETNASLQKIKNEINRVAVDQKNGFVQCKDELKGFSQ